MTPMNKKSQSGSIPDRGTKKINIFSKKHNVLRFFYTYIDVRCKIIWALSSVG